MVRSFAKKAVLALTALLIELLTCWPGPHARTRPSPPPSLHTDFQEELGAQTLTDLFEVPTELNASARFRRLHGT